MGYVILLCHSLSLPYNYFDFIVMLLIVKILVIHFYQPIIMIFSEFVLYVLIYVYTKFRKDPSITSQAIANYLSVALAVALSVVLIPTANRNNRQFFR